MMKQGILMHKDELYNQLKMKIFNEEIPPGTWLVEREISEKYNVSRTPVREILRVLASDGLIIFEPTKGYSVRKLGFDEIVEIFNARESLEGMASRLACIRGDQDFFSNIKKIRKQLEQVDVKKDPSLGVEIGHTLHNAIVKEANNKILDEFYQKLNNLSALTRNLTKRSVEIEVNSQKDHIAIADAILEKDEDKSEQAMRKHIKSTCLLLTQYHLMEQTGLVSNLNA
jgi:DNA-binding GntR family transcriptional regulator